MVVVFWCSVCLLDVGQHPRLIKERLLRAVETEEDFEFSIGVSGDPIGFDTCRDLQAEVDIYGPIGFFLEAGAVGRPAGPLPSKLTVGMPQITAWMARCWIMRSAR